MILRDLPAVLGVEAIDVDLNQPLDDAAFALLRSAFERRSVLVVRDQRLTPDAHIDFSRRFGELEIHVQKQFLLPGHPELLVVSNEFVDGKPIGLVDAGHYWHSDLSYKAEPSLASALHAQVLPAEGGDTLFVDMHAAYDALDAETQARIDGLTAIHSYAARNAAQNAKTSHRPALTEEQKRAVPEVEHPMVRVHPATGRKALFVNEGFTTRVVGLPEDEGAALLQRLCAHMIEPRFIYRHRWQARDLVMWDNRATIHLATGCPPHLARTLYRTTIKGDRPTGPSASSLAA